LLTITIKYDPAGHPKIKNAYTFIPQLYIIILLIFY